MSNSCEMGAACSSSSPPTITVEGGFNIYKTRVCLKLKNFGPLFLSTTEHFRLLTKQSETIEIKAGGSVPACVIKLSLWYGPDPDLEDQNEVTYLTELLRYDEGEFLSYWPILIRCELIRPTNFSSFKGLYFNMELETDAANQSSSTPVEELCKKAGPVFMQQLKLCTISNRQDVLRVNVNADGTLILPLILRFYQNNSNSQQCFGVDNAIGELRENANRRLQNFLAEDVSNLVTLIANNEERFTVHKNPLIAYSPVFAAMFSNNCREANENVIKFDKFSPAVLRWIVNYLKTLETGPFGVLRSDDPELPNLQELVEFTHMYQMQDLVRYFDNVLPEVCHDNPELAPDLNRLAVKFGLNHAKEKIQEVIMRSMDLMVQVMNDVN